MHLFSHWYLCFKLCFKIRHKLSKIYSFINTCGSNHQKSFIINTMLYCSIETLTEFTPSLFDFLYFITNDVHAICSCLFKIYISINHIFHYLLYLLTIYRNVFSHRAHVICIGAFYQYSQLDHQYRFINVNCTHWLLYI